MNLTALENQMLTALSFNYCFQEFGFELWSSQIDETGRPELLPSAAQHGGIIASLKKKGLLRVSGSGTKDSLIMIPEETAAVMVELREKVQG